MTNKKTTLLKTEKFISLYPNILFFQHMNLSVKQWSNLRVQLKQIEKTDLLLLKNSIIETTILKQTLPEKENLQKIFQGPCFAIGFFQHSQLSAIMTLLDKVSNIYLVGGIVNNTLVTHLDILKYLKLDDSIYQTLVSQFNQPQIFYNMIQTSLNFSILQKTQLNLLHYLELSKAIK